MTSPLYHEPTDAPDLPIIAVDSELMQTVAHQYGLAIEIDGDHAHLTLDGIEFVAPINELTAVSA